MRLFIIILFVGFVLSCSSQINKRSNFKYIDYYETDSPFVIVFEYDSNGIINRIYDLVEKIGINNYLTTRFDRNFKEKFSRLDSVAINGVYLNYLKYPFFASTEKEKEPELVFSFSDSVRDFHMKGILYNYKDSFALAYDWQWQIDSVVTDYSTWKGRRTVISIGVLQRYVDFLNGSTSNESINTSTWYVEGIGNIRQVFKSKEFVITTEFIEIISVRDFKKLRKGALKE